MMPIRRARVDDHAHMLDLWERSVRATHHFLDESDIASLRPLVAEEIESPGLEWWVITSDLDHPLGFLAFADNVIEGLFIDPDYHGRGSGRALVAHAQQLAGGTLSVDVNEQNTSALRFYRSVGFEVTGRSDTDSAGRPFPILHLTRDPSAAPEI